MIERACECGVTEIWVLDHTHKFVEFKPVYEIIRADAFNRLVRPETADPAFEF